MTCDSTVEMPIVVVESDEDKLVKAERPDETWALVGLAPSAVMVEMAVENSTAREVVPDRLVLSRVAPLSAVETTTPAEVVADSAVEVMPLSEVWLDFAVLVAVESDWSCERLVCGDSDVKLLSADDSVVETEFWDDVTLETEAVIVRPPGSVLCNAWVCG